MFAKPTSMPGKDEALPGRPQKMVLESTTHFVNGNKMTPPWPEGFEQAQFGMGCFWGVEKLFWQVHGVWVTAVGYAAGFTPNPSYEELCTGKTGHNEVVLVVFDPTIVHYSTLLQTFCQGHDPSQHMRQGNDVGTQYRSGIYTSHDDQQYFAKQSMKAYQVALNKQGYGSIQTEILPASTFYYAEQEHQQYLAKVPNGYCGLGGTGVYCPMPK